MIDLLRLKNVFNDITYPLYTDGGRNTTSAGYIFTSSYRILSLKFKFVLNFWFLYLAPWSHWPWLTMHGNRNRPRVQPEFTTCRPRGYSSAASCPKRMTKYLAVVLDQVDHDGKSIFWGWQVVTKRTPVHNPIRIYGIGLVKCVGSFKFKVVLL